ncbi:unnamed protein product [Rotaria magnacalcarata]|uniref:Uncharacterized protein n=4 Tax=Rotaria magnacalcarata TaxID=392030 RepID=A0A816PRR5_9BILA|nr:unnamed protein product [Rotaria magnacalcarata]CAF2169066.1 unnamed protein product [Rotaria magnacalcarata]CAF3932434.1 unnamed protein product [Rotaria magnacalcarata]CAF4020596.1 unnamed protein product [Rotaria magnacalcarata]
MDLELRCPSCKEYYRSPVYLPCTHSLCYACALTSIQTTNEHHHNQSTLDISSTSFASDLDKLSLTSDNDSGVIINRHSPSSSNSSSSSSSSSSISSSSRPSSILLPPALPEISSSFIPTAPIRHQTNKPYSTCLQCPVCSKIIFMDISGIRSLPKNCLLTDIVSRYLGEKSYEQQQPQTPKCQLCRPSEERAITRICEQCRIGYCDQCREQYHPMRGPYSKHNFVNALQQFSNNLNEKIFCHEHSNRLATSYCLHCRLECCQQCSIHTNHDTVPIQQAAKLYKTQLSSQLQCLSEKAKYGAEFLAKLKLYPDYIKKNGEIFETNLVKDIDNLIQTLENKKQELVTYVHKEIERKISLIHQQCSTYNAHIQRTTGFLQFSIEALKESDPLAYLQVCHGLNSKCSSIYGSFSDEYECKAHTSFEFDFTFNTDSLYREIHRLQFQQIKPPLSPRFIAEQCLCHDEPSGTISGTLAWSMRDVGAIQGFILELDDGTFASDFREVYDGTETMCAVDGLLLSNVYTARVKAYNQAGESAYSECITLHSSSVYWFTFNPRTAHPDIQFISNSTSLTNDNHYSFDSITCLSSQERVALGSRGFRKGKHYWEITIQRYDDKPDPAFGVARFDVLKEHMLGKDAKSWCMYIDSQRSWFMHNGQHTNRINSGITVGSVIGILLDLNNGTLSFYINDEPHGPIAFSNLTQGGVYYPAVSLNKNVQLTLVSGLDAPTQTNHEL